MTVRLFDENAYQTEFTAVVVRCEERKNGYAVILNQTCFFPEEGGQTADEGVLFVGEKCIPVTDVQIDKQSVIRHHVSCPIAEGTAIRGKIQWEKRFSDMQQHTGEHIVSGLIHAAFGYQNVGFHLSANEVTLDLNGMLTAEQIAEIERRANDAVYHNLEVIAEYPEPAVLAELEYRSKIEIEGPVRIVTIPGVDCCACCAPHVARTGEIGLIKIVHAAKYKSGIRLNMLCGQRALIDAQIKQNQIEAIGIALSVQQDKTAAAVQKLQDELAQKKLQLTAMRKQVAASRAQCVSEGAKNVCLFEPELDKEIQRELVNQISARCVGVCGVFVGSDAKGYRYVIGSAGEQDARECNQRLKECCEVRGGGSRDMVQGSVKGTEEQIRAVFAAGE